MGGNPHARKRRYHGKPAPRPRPRSDRGQQLIRMAYRPRAAQAQTGAISTAQGIAGRVRDDRRVRGGDGFRRVPELGGRRERQNTYRTRGQGHEPTPREKAAIGCHSAYGRLWVGHARSIGDSCRCARRPGGALCVLAGSNPAADSLGRRPPDTLSRKAAARCRREGVSSSPLLPTAVTQAGGRGGLPSHRRDTPRTSSAPTVERYEDAAFNIARSGSRYRAGDHSRPSRDPDRERDQAVSRNRPSSGNRSALARLILMICRPPGPSASDTGYTAWRGRARRDRPR